MSMQTVNITNKRAEYEYELLEEYVAGIQLVGTEIKSIRLGRASLKESFCYFRNGELFIKMHITEYKHGGHYNHEPRRERKLLMKKRELRKLEYKVKIKGFTLVPTRLFIDEETNGYAKVELYLAKGKRKYDKRQTLKKKDAKREMDRLLKDF